MNQLFNTLSTREQAIGLWILIALAACLLSKSIRKSLARVLIALFAWKIVVSLLIFFTHTAVYIFILYKAGFWNSSLLKDTIMWTLSFGFVSLMNINKVNDTGYFKKVFLDAIKWTIGIEFVVNFFTFSLVKEIVLVPVIVISAMLQAAASFDPKHARVEKLIKNILMLLSLSIFAWSLYKTIEKHSELFTVDNLKSFLLPVILTITFLPFMYMYNLVVKYETLWVQLRFIIRNEKDRKRVKRQILLIANVDVNKLMSISRNIAKPVNVYNDLSKEMLMQISRGQYIGHDE